LTTGTAPTAGPGGTGRGPAKLAVKGPGSPPNRAAAAPRAGAVALAPQAGPSPRPNLNSNPGSLDKLNARLNSMLPSGDVAYSHREYGNTIDEAVEEAQAEYLKKVAPPPGVLARALEIVRQKGTLLGPPTIVYILKRERILGFEICTGWKIEQPPGGGEPQGGYTFGPCGGEQFTPPAGLPTLTPKSTATPEPGAT
jgi:hypothetical protein